MLSGIEALIRMGTPYIVAPSELRVRIWKEDIHDEVANYKGLVIEQFEKTASTLRSVLARIGDEKFRADRLDEPLVIAMGGVGAWMAMPNGILPRRRMHVVAAIWEDANFGRIGSFEPSDGAVFRRELRLRMEAWDILFSGGEPTLDI